MLWIIVSIAGVLVFFAALFVLGDLFEYGGLTAVGKIVAIVLIVSLVVLGGGAVGLNKIYDLNYEETVQTGDYKLVSMTDTGALSGKDSDELYYVCVSIQQEEEYSFYYQLDNGEVKKVKVYAENIAISLKDDCTPHVIEYTTYTKNQMDKTLKELLIFDGESTQKTYKVYIPTATILEKLNSQ